MVNIDSEGVHWISLFQKKTKDYIEIPMSDTAIEIYKRFESHRKTTGFVLPMLQHYCNIFKQKKAEKSGKKH